MTLTLIPRDRLVVGPRQRKKIEAAPLVDLRESIAETRLLHPIVVQKNEDAGWTLIAGERRLRAIDSLAEQNRTFICGDSTVQPGEVPVISIMEFLSEQQRFESELAENLYREDLEWADRARALADLHAMRQQAKPTTMKETAQELVDGGAFGSVKAAQAAVSEAVIVAKHLDNPAVAKARNAKEAFNLITRMEEDRVNSVLARRLMAEQAKAEISIALKHGDCLKELMFEEENKYDLILSDPPYGIGADTGGFRQRTVIHHNYEDTPEYARKILQAIIVDGFKITKPRANMFLFTDISHWDFLLEASRRMGWTPWRMPIIWQKSRSEGLAPWGTHGFRHVYDVIFFATKGEKGLFHAPIDIIDVPRVARDERLHAAEKPIPLLKQLIAASTMPGDWVLDPCAGSGSTLVACRESQRRCMGIEASLDTYNSAMSNIFTKGALADA